jgi:hypothetical protein
MRETARALLCQGRLREALQAGGGEPDRALAEAIAAGERVLRGLGFGEAGEDGALGGIMLAPAGKARGLVVVFGEDGGGFALPRALSHGRAAHVLFVRDPRRSLAMLGVARLGADYDACLMAVLRIARHLGARDIFCVGGGLAAYSALRFGLDLGAEGVLALGTLARLERGATPAGLGPARQVARLMRVAGALGADLAHAYARAATRPGLVLCRPHADALAGLAALPGAVSVDGPPGSEAALLAWADEGGRLRDMLHKLMACRAVQQGRAG